MQIIIIFLVFIFNNLISPKIVEYKTQRRNSQGVYIGVNGLLRNEYANLEGHDDLTMTNSEEIKRLLGGANPIKRSIQIIDQGEKFQNGYKETGNPRSKSIEEYNEFHLAQVKNLQFFFFLELLGLCIAGFYFIRLFRRKTRLILELTNNNFTTNKRYNEAIHSLQGMKNLNRKLNKANACRDRFFSIIAHDLRAPYNVMLGYTGVLVNSFDSLKLHEIKEYIMILHKTAHKNYKLTQNLLSWAILQREGLEINKQELNMTKLIDGAINVHIEMAQQKGVRLVNLCPATLSGILDKDIANAVLSNLISNALKFTPKNGTVMISAKKRYSKIVFKIVDSGIGMSKRISRNLYKLTSLHSRAGTENEQGSGLGLILCKELLHRHRGSIKVISKNGKGTVVFASF